MTELKLLVISLIDIWIQDVKKAFLNKLGVLVLKITYQLVCLLYAHI